MAERFGTRDKIVINVLNYILFTFNGRLFKTIEIVALTIIAQFPKGNNGKAPTKAKGSGMSFMFLQRDRSRHR
jgi:hypothetical protein